MKKLILLIVCFSLSSCGPDYVDYYKVKYIVKSSCIFNIKILDNNGTTYSEYNKSGDQRFEYTKQSGTRIHCKIKCYDSTNEVRLMIYKEYNKIREVVGNGEVEILN